MPDQCLLDAPSFGDDLPDVIPAWVLEDPFFHEEPTCDCGCSLLDVSSEQPVGWAIPGVTGLTSVTKDLPEPSPQVAAALAAVAALADVVPTSLGAAQALADAQALLQLEQQLRVLDLQRIADVGARGLHELVGFRSARTWLRTLRPDGDTGDARLAAQLRDLPVLSAAVASSRCSLAAARKVVDAFRKCAPYLDKEDGLIDGQPGDELLLAVVGNALAHVCRDLLGLADDDPRLAQLVAEAKALLAHDGTQAQRLEAVFTWVSEHVRPRSLPGVLDELVVSILPSELERRGERGHSRRGLALEPKPDGSGWHVCSDLDLECGERLWTALRAEASRDPRNPDDTRAWEAAGTPRTKRERMHDAFSRVLGRFLDEGLGGVMGKSPVQIHVTLTEQNVTGRPGAAPARGDSGRLIPRALVRRWWCDSSVSAYVLSLGGKALRVIHGQRTLNAAERRALSVEGGGRCAGEGCCPDRPDPMVVLRPHHVLGYAEDQITSLDESLPVCDTLHHDLHSGHRTVRLRDGRYLNEHGFTDAPSLFDHPPF